MSSMDTGREGEASPCEFLGKNSKAGKIRK
jgi:hypothetical protein